MNLNTLHCPNCDRELGNHQQVGGTTPLDEADRAVTMCVACGTIFWINYGQPGNPLTPEELAELAKKKPTELALMRQSLWLYQQAEMDHAFEAGIAKAAGTPPSEPLAATPPADKITDLGPAGQSPLRFAEMPEEMGEKLVEAIAKATMRIMPSDANYIGIIVRSDGELYTFGTVPPSQLPATLRQAAAFLEDLPPGINEARDD